MENFKKEPAIIDWPLRMFFLFSRFMGLTPVTFTRTTTSANVWKMRFSTVAILYSCIIHISLFGLNTYMRLLWSTENTVNISLRLERLIEYLGGTTCLFTAVLSSRMRINNIMTLLATMMQVDRHFKERFRKSDRKIFFVVTVLLLGSYIVSLEEVIRLATIGLDPVLQFLPTDITMLACIALEYEFVLIASALAIRADALLTYIRDCYLATDTGAHAAITLARLRTSYALQTQLRSCMRALSSAYGITFISLLVLLLFETMVNIFHAIDHISTQEGDLLHMDIQWICLTTILFLFLVEPCHRFTTMDEKISFTACETLLKLNASGSLCGIREQIRLRTLWNQQFAYVACPVRFSVAGLCHLNRELLASVAGVITTYVVILLQVS